MDEKALAEDGVRGRWARKSLAYIEPVLHVIEGLREYWPLTLRQVYYQLVSAGTIENNRNAYAKLTRMLGKARLDGMVDWRAIEDRSRAMLESEGWSG